MKNLKTFADFLRKEKLEEYTRRGLALLKTENLQIMRLIKDISEEDLYKMSLASNEQFFTSLVEDTAILISKERLRLWEEDKLPGVGRDDILPSDLVEVYAFQKKLILHFLPSHTRDLSEALNVLSELDAYYAMSMNNAVKMLFRVQKNTEIRLRESEERYRDLFENTTDVIHILDNDRKIRYVNKSWLREMGYTMEEVTDAFLSRFIDQGSSQTYEYAEQKAREGKEEDTVEIAFISKNGDRLILEGNISCKFSGETPEFTRGIFKNITRRKAVELELAGKTRELQRSNSELEQFAYVASHDLQEPLRMINSYIQLLASRYKDKLDQDANDFIHFAVDGSNRMRTLINSLLEYSRVNRIKPFEWTNTGTILADVLVDLENTIIENSATIHYTQLPSIYCDPVLIGQLFLNLIGNAIKFKGSTSPDIYISGEEKDGHFIFSVKDNGIGIQKAYFDKIFVIFQRLNSMDKYKGTGIGLAICKKIVERHGGEIWVESEPGKGSAFYFTIK
jgi:PAS domain S-box-containing protein